MSERGDTPLAIEARGLVKRYNEEVLAVDGVDLTVPKNIIYTLLGPNGAGKTTTISILTTLLEPTEGSASVLGLDVVKQAGAVRERIGVTFQEMVLDDELTVLDRALELGLEAMAADDRVAHLRRCLLYTSPSPRD